MYQFWRWLLSGVVTEASWRYVLIRMTIAKVIGEVVTQVVLECEETSWSDTHRGRDDKHYFGWIVSMNALRFYSENLMMSCQEDYTHRDVRDEDFGSCISLDWTGWLQLETPKEQCRWELPKISSQDARQETTDGDTDLKRLSVLSVI